MSYAKLEQRFVQLHHLPHLGAICGWDRATMMPAGTWSSVICDERQASPVANADQIRQGVFHGVNR